MSCPKCIAPKINGPREACREFIGFHAFCHRPTCRYAWGMHKGAARVRVPDSDRVRPTLTVIDGGANEDDDARQWGAWLEGEQL